MLNKVSYVMASLVLIMSGCAQAAAPQTVGIPQPSATLEKAPTRTPFAPPTENNPFPTAATGGVSSTSQTPATLIGTPVPPPRLSGQFVFAPGDGSIWVQDAATGDLRLLVKPTAELFAEAPGFSPNGKLIAYMESKLSAAGAAVNSIRIIDADGKNDHVLAAPADAKTSFGWPAFTADGKWVYFTAYFPVPPGSEHFEVQRVPASGGQPQLIFQDAQSVIFSPDGSQLVFTRFNPTTFSASLWIAGTDGKNAKQILPDDIFSAIASSRFSPDGKWVLFAASGPPVHPLPGGMLLPREECEPRLLCALAGNAYADGLPWDLWLVSVDGKHFEQLTNVGFDSPWPAWSSDGKYVAIFETSGFYILDLGRRLLSQWKAEGGHGVMDWWMPSSK